MPSSSPFRGLRRLGLLAATAALAGCEALALTALGVGASAGVNHTAEGISSRTFTAPPQRVKAASLAALQRMGIRLDGIEPHEGGELIKASSAERSIEIELEAMSRSTTQMRATAKRGLFTYDAATAKEIVEQTAQAMDAPRRARRASSGPAAVPPATATHAAAAGAKAAPAAGANAGL